MANISRLGSRVDPFTNLVDDFFTGFLVRPLAVERERTSAQAGLVPRMQVDISEKDAAYQVRAELPGVKKEHIEVMIDGAQLSLAAEVKREVDAAADERVLHAERVFGKATRSFTLPQEVDEAQVQARFHNGVLELTLPKKTATARKQISIQ